MKVGVIDYGVGNLGSVMQALEELNVSAVRITQAVDISSTDCLILPGVGNFSDCMELLEKGNWPKAIHEEVEVRKKPLLGICVGMQLLASAGMEGATEHDTGGTSGLGLIPGHVEHLRTLGCGIRIPHVGWNEISCCADNDRLFSGIPDSTDFYFVHSYAFVAQDSKHVLATTDYDITVTAVVKHRNIWGTQFHPEKSSRAGFRLLHNFVETAVC